MYEDDKVEIHVRCYSGGKVRLETDKVKMHESCDSGKVIYEEGKVEIRVRCDTGKVIYQHAR